MSPQQINLSPDLKRLRDEGYEIEVRSGYLLMHHIPYLSANQALRYGTLVTDLTMSGQRTTLPSYHVVYFVGDHPCKKDGRPIPSIQHQSLDQALLPDLVVQHSFSNKPASGYTDYYHKMTRYADIITAPAKSLYPGVTEKTFKAVSTHQEEEPFQYWDTNSSRANIYPMNAKLSGQRIAIIGLGGTGAYILDLVAKTPVLECHTYDGDVLQTHNAFRSPGAASLDQLDQQPLKVDYYTEIYSRMHKRIIPHGYYMSEEHLAELAQMHFVFIAIDNNKARAVIASYLISVGIPFIDVGLGVNRVEQGDSLLGLVRVTAATKAQHDHLALRLPQGTDAENEYATNIQIADLNALNATLAVIKWKKLCGFYQDTSREMHSVYSVHISEFFHEDEALTA